MINHGYLLRELPKNKLELIFFLVTDMSFNTQTKENAIHEVVSIEGESLKEVSQPPKKWYEKTTFFRPTKFKSAEEKRLVRKLDLILLLWANIAYTIKSIDQSNVSNAYVSGMKEELGFKGTDYNKLDTFFRIGYAIFLVPSQVMLQKVNPAHWLSGCELVWGILTALCAVAKTPQHLYPLRFFMGVFESSSWPGLVNILFNYYTREELASRIAWFQISSSAAGMFAGSMQAAIHKTLNGKQGLAGWKWMFIINGLMTIVISLAGFYCIPDTPADGGARYWMNDRDREMALERAARSGMETKRSVTIKDFYSTFLDWKVWLFVFSFAPMTWSIPYSYFNLWLKSLLNTDGTVTYSVEQLNTIPIGNYAVQLVAVLLYGVLTELTGNPLPFILIQAVIGIYSNAVFVAWSNNRAFIFSTFFISGLSSATSTIQLVMLSEVFSKNPQRRSIATGITVVFVYANLAWLQLFLWPANQAPHFKYGYKVSIGLCVATALFSTLFAFYCYKPALKKNQEEELIKKNEEGLTDDISDQAISSDLDNEYSVEAANAR